MSQMFKKARRSDFYDITAFILNPLPPSFVERTEFLPDTVQRAFTWERGEFYPDLGECLPETSFDVNVLVTRSVDSCFSTQQSCKTATAPHDILPIAMIECVGIVPSLHRQLSLMHLMGPGHLMGIGT